MLMKMTYESVKEPCRNVRQHRAYCICNADMTYIKSQFCLKNRLRMQNNKTGASSESQTRHRTDSTVVKLSSKL